MKVRLWHNPYNGGWIWFDRKQLKRCDGGYGIEERNHIGELEKDKTLWWCIFGFCGRILLQSWPWQNHPGKSNTTHG